MRLEIQTETKTLGMEGAGDSFFAFAKHAWWPTENARAAMPEKYENVDNTKEVYWSLWYDSENSLLYVERGAW